MCFKSEQGRWMGSWDAEIEVEFNFLISEDLVDINVNFVISNALHNAFVDLSQGTFLKPLIPLFTTTTPYPISLSMRSLHAGPNLLIAQITALLAAASTPMPVNSHPFPIAAMSGSAMIAPTQEQMLRTKLLAATPEEARLGMNSVSMVVAMAKMSMLPTPKKKLAMSCGSRGC